MTFTYELDGEGGSEGPAVALDFNLHARLTRLDATQMEYDITKNVTDEIGCAWTTDSLQPNVLDWPFGNYNASINVNSYEDANPTFKFQLLRVNVVGLDIREILGTSGSITGTGQQTYQVEIDPGSDFASDRYQLRLLGSNAYAHGARWVKFDFDATSYIDGPWSVGPVIETVYPRVLTNLSPFSKQLQTLALNPFALITTTKERNHVGLLQNLYPHASILLSPLSSLNQALILNPSAGVGISGLQTCQTTFTIDPLVSIDLQIRAALESTYNLNRSALVNLETLAALASTYDLTPSVIVDAENVSVRELTATMNVFSSSLISTNMKPAWELFVNRSAGISLAAKRTIGLLQTIARSAQVDVSSLSQLQQILITNPNVLVDAEGVSVRELNVILNLAAQAQVSANMKPVLGFTFNRSAQVGVSAKPALNMQATLTRSAQVLLSAISKLQSSMTINRKAEVDVNALANMVATMVAHPSVLVNLNQLAVVSTGGGQVETVNASVALALAINKVLAGTLSANPSAEVVNVIRAAAVLSATLTRSALINLSAFTTRGLQYTQDSAALISLTSLSTRQVAYSINPTTDIELAIKAALSGSLSTYPSVIVNNLHRTTLGMTASLDRSALIALSALARRGLLYTHDASALVAVSSLSARQVTLQLSPSVDISLVERAAIGLSISLYPRVIASIDISMETAQAFDLDRSVQLGVSAKGTPIVTFTLSSTATIESVNRAISGLIGVISAKAQIGVNNLVTSIRLSLGVNPSVATRIYNDATKGMAVTVRPSGLIEVKNLVRTASEFTITPTAKVDILTDLTRHGLVYTVSASGLISVSTPVTTSPSAQYFWERLVARLEDEIDDLEAGGGGITYTTGDVEGTSYKA